MNADFLAEHSEYDDDSGYEGCECGWREEQERRSESGTVFTHAEHVAAAWREHRTITRVEQLDALPIGAIVVEPVGHAWIKHETTRWHCSCDGTDVEWGSGLLVQDSHLPLLLVWHPIEDGAQ